MRNLMAILWAACAPVACSSNPVGPVDPAEFVLAPGESALVSSASLTVRFDRVVSDSRCPADAICVTAGEAEVALSVRRGEGPADGLSLRTGERRDRAQLGDWVLELVQLAPYPYSDRPIAPGDYRATLRVEGLAQRARD